MKVVHAWDVPLIVYYNKQNDSDLKITTLIFKEHSHHHSVDYSFYIFFASHFLFSQVCYQHFIFYFKFYITFYSKFISNRADSLFLWFAVCLTHNKRTQLYHSLSPCVLYRHTDRPVTITTSAQTGKGKRNIAACNMQLATCNMQLATCLTHMG